MILWFYKFLILKLQILRRTHVIYCRQYLFVIFLIMIIRADLVNEACGATFLEDFSSYQMGICFADQSTLEEWYVVFHGFGCTKIENTTNPQLHEAPVVSQLPAETHASLVVGPSFAGPISYRGKLLTEKQLRVNSSPNPWEVAWAIWNYQDNEHFYYFIPKPNGWELGKRDPAYPGGQRFLATGSAPSFPIRKWYSFQVTQDAKNTISVYVNGLLITKYTDTESPYTAGAIGLYNEDAHVHFDNISVTRL
jgi:large repetitive protein